MASYFSCGVTCVLSKQFRVTETEVQYVEYEESPSFFVSIWRQYRMDVVHWETGLVNI